MGIIHRSIQGWIGCGSKDAKAFLQFGNWIKIIGEILNHIQFMISKWNHLFKRIVIRDDRLNWKNRNWNKFLNSNIEVDGFCGLVLQGIYLYECWRMHWCDLVWYCNIIPQVLHVLTDSGQMQQFTINCTNIAKLWYFFERLLLRSIYIAKTKKQGILLVFRAKIKRLLSYLPNSISKQYECTMEDLVTVCQSMLSAVRISSLK